METFGTTLDRYKGFGPGFDFIRIALAIGILAYHSTVVTGIGVQLTNTPEWIVTDSLVPMFFAVSGFLIAGSALRLRLSDFLINRGLRIIPALAVEIILSAVLLGSFFTTLPISEYFQTSGFLAYFLNIVGYIHYQLPGVFNTNPSNVVNQSLWTVPYEFLCYAVVSFMMLTGLIKRRAIILLLAISYILVGVALQIRYGVQGTSPAVKSLFFGRGSLAFECFLAGIATYHFRDVIPYRRYLAATSFLLWLAIAVVGNKSWGNTGILSVILCPLLTYLILFIGLSPVPKVPLYSKGDYSYGVYLYGYPMQQSIETLSRGKASFLLNLISSLLIVTLWAMFSWHFIEKPILKMRKHFSFVGRQLSEKNAEHLPFTPSTPEAITPGG